MERTVLTTRAWWLCTFTLQHNTKTPQNGFTFQNSLCCESQKLIFHINHFSKSSQPQPTIHWTWMKLIKWIMKIAITTLLYCETAPSIEPISKPQSKILNRLRTLSDLIWHPWIERTLGFTLQVWTNCWDQASTLRQWSGFILYPSYLLYLRYF